MSLWERRTFVGQAACLSFTRQTGKAAYPTGCLTKVHAQMDQIVHRDLKKGAIVLNLGVP